MWRSTSTVTPCGCTRAPVARARFHTFSTCLLALLPKLGCPLCWPMLAAACSLVGLRMSLLDPVLTAITLVVLALSLWTAFRRGSLSPPHLLSLASLVALALYRLFPAPIWLGYAGGAGLLAGTLLQRIYPFHATHQHSLS